MKPLTPLFKEQTALALCLLAGYPVLGLLFPTDFWAVLPRVALIGLPVLGMTALYTHACGGFEGPDRPVLFGSLLSFNAALIVCELFLFGAMIFHHLASQLVF